MNIIEKLKQLRAEYIERKKQEFKASQEWLRNYIKHPMTDEEVEQWNNDIITASRGDVGGGYQEKHIKCRTLSLNKHLLPEEEVEDLYRLIFKEAREKKSKIKM